MNFANLTKRIVGASCQLSRLLAFNNIKSFGIRSIGTTQIKFDESKINEDVNKKLMEFFDDKKNWNENEVKHGRSWQLPELRIKSNADLHKIWFVLLKERNMLMTMEHTHLEEWRWWASPERLDKVKDSMQNIETVVRERNKAYYELETGVDGERPGQVHTNVLGMKGYRKYHEHVIPFYMNKKWREKNPKPVGGRDMFNFLKLYRERIYNDKRKARVRDRNHLIRLIRRFPDLDRNMLQEKYPNVAVRNLEKKDLFRGHYVPRVD